MKDLQKVQLDNIFLGNKVMVSDPCYVIGTWCQIPLDNVKPGEYTVHVIKSDEEDWGIREASLIIKHVDKDTINEIKEHPEEVGVDSGQAGIFDMSIYPENPHTRTAEDVFYDECCNITLSKKSCGTLSNKKGVVSSSGYGDGGYSLYYSEDENGQIDFMHIVFIGPDVDSTEYATDEDYDEAYEEQLMSHIANIHNLIFC